MQAGQPLEAVITNGLAHANVVGVLAHSWHCWHPQALQPSVSASAPPADVKALALLQLGSYWPPLPLFRWSQACKGAHVMGAAAVQVTVMQRWVSTTNLWDSPHSEVVLHGPENGGSESLRLIMEFCNYGTLQVTRSLALGHLRLLILALHTPGSSR